MIIRFWGVRGSIPAPGPDTIRYGGNTSCVSVTGANGGLVIIAPPGGRTPASEWMAVSSRDSSRERSGRMPGMRSASVVLPAPFGPLSITWCPPAAATSRE